MSAASPSALEVAGGDGARLEGELDEARALGVLRQVLHAEALEERAQVGLDRLDAEHEVVGDLAVRRRGDVRARLAVGPAQGDEHAALGLGQDRPRDAAPDYRGLDALAGRAEGDLRPAEAHDVAVLQAVATDEPLAVDERPVARKAVVLDGPVAAEALELRVHAGDLRIPVHAD